MWRAIAFRRFLVVASAALPFGSACDGACESGPAVPAGTRFQVTVIEELPESTECGRLPLSTGSTFELTAAPPVEHTSGPQVCSIVPPAAPPDVPGTVYEFLGCTRYHVSWGMQCSVRYRGLCASSTASSQGSIELFYRHGPDAVEVWEGLFEISDHPLPECRDAVPICHDQFLVRVEPVQE